MSDTAELVVPCADLDAALAAFTEILGYRVDAVIPADDPAEVVVSRDGHRVRLVRGDGPLVVRLFCDDAGLRERASGALDGLPVEVVSPDRPLVVPDLVPELVVSRAADAEWIAGRAGMRYRDLIPGRLGGRYVASEIEIADGGPVPDYVHFHDVRFQMIFCRSGWVRVVYEDQGPPFVLAAGDCVLQPPGIRHRVLECSAGLRVIEVSSPAAHPTYADHECRLPTDLIDPARDFGGQRFQRSVAAEAEWREIPPAGAAIRDLGLLEPSGALAKASVIRSLGEGHGRGWSEGDAGAELRLRVILAGSVLLLADGESPIPLVEGDACALPAGTGHAFTDPSPDLELLEVLVGPPD